MRCRQDRQHELRDLFVARISLEHTLIPRTCTPEVARLPADVSQVPERNQVLWIERQCGLEDGAGLIEAGKLEEGLPVDDMAAHVPGLLGQILLADEDGLLEITR